jgi:hypothetical protein
MVELREEVTQVRATATIARAHTAQEERVAQENAALLDERLGPDLPRCRGKSIGEDLNIDDEGSEQNFEPLQSLHHYSIGNQSVQPKLTSPRRLIPASTIENTGKNKVDTI